MEQGRVETVVALVLQIEVLTSVWVRVQKGNTEILVSIWVPNVRERAIQGDFIADVNVKSIFSVGLVHSLSIGQREGLPLFSVSYTLSIPLSCIVEHEHPSCSLDV